MFATGETLSGVTNDECRGAIVRGEYRFASHYRKFLAWIAIFWSYSIFTLRWAHLAIMGKDPWSGDTFDWALRVGLILLPMMVVMPVFCWRLRVNECGIWRRRCVRWELWSWASLASGRVMSLSFGRFRDADRPWWRRTLSLEWLEPEEYERVGGICESVIPPQPSAAVSIPDSLAIRYGPIWSRKELQMDRFHVRDSGSPREIFRWDEVQQLQVWVRQRGSAQVDRIRLCLPEQTIEFGFHRGGEPSCTGKPNWTGPGLDVIAAYLRRHVPSSRVRLRSSTGPPHDRQEVDDRLADVEERLRRLRGSREVLWILWAWTACSALVGPVTIVIMAVWMRIRGIPFPDVISHFGGQLASLLAAAPAWCLPPWIIVWFATTTHQKQRAWLQSYRAAFPVHTGESTHGTEGGL